MKKIAVYGSLLSGLGNHVLLSSGNAKLVSTEYISVPYGMISYGAFPALVPSKLRHGVHIEIYECDETTYKRVEALEGYPNFYQKYIATTSLGQVEIYVIDKEKAFETHDTSMIVEDGNWRRFKSEKSRNITNYSIN